ncbi:MAG: proton-conducting transporter membrane subunit [Candidatus Ratteibacteria bacterium]|nr:proton-conducting transporter membrane subunit [Candidatus Ratteibacteria bacterium]
MSYIVILPVLIYLVGAFLIFLLWRKDEKLAGAAGISFVCLSALTSVLSGIEVFTDGKMLHFIGICKSSGMVFMLDPLSSLFLIMANTLALLIMVYSAIYMKRYARTPYFYILFLVMLAGMSGILISTDIISIFVFLEVASIASFGLITFGPKAKELVRPMKIVGTIASIIILFAIALIYGTTGTINVSEFMSKTAGLSPTHLWFIAGLLLSVFALISALVPFHLWLPDAQSVAPAPVSALLSGIFVKVVGLYVIIRITTNIFITLPQIRVILLLLGSLSMVFGGLMAYGQKNIRQVYAYSTISQMGYCAVALGIGGYLGSLGVLMYCIAHTFANSLLFLDIGATEYAAGTAEADELIGLNDRMPTTSLFGRIGMLCIAGIPPMGNFWGQIIIIIAAVKAGWCGIAVLCIIIAILTLGYFLRLQRSAFSSKTESPVGKEVPKTLLVPMGILTILVLLSGILLVPGIKEHTLDRAVSVMEHFTYMDIRPY